MEQITLEPELEPKTLDDGAVTWNFCSGSTTLL